MERLASWFHKTKPKRILDLASGAGNFIHMIKQMYDEFDTIVGIDSLEYAVNSATKNFSEDDRISFEQMNAESTTFENNSFDLITLSNSLHHLADPSVVFNEINRLLEPGGYLLVSEMMSDNLSTRQQSHLKLHHFAAEMDRERGEVHNETYSKKEILSILRDMPQAVEESWELEFERSTDNTQEEIDWLISTIDRLVGRLNDSDKQDTFRQKGETIKDYINIHGFDSATTLIVVMKR